MSLIFLRKRAPWLSDGDSPSNTIAAYHLRGAASQSSSYVNLANPGSYSLTDVVRPGWDAVNGLTGDGVSQTVNTGIPLPNGSYAPYTILIRFSNAPNSNGAIAGSTDVSWNFGIFLCPRIYGSSSYYWNYSELLVSGVSASSGIIGLVGQNGYLNGVYSGPIGGHSISNYPTLNLLSINTSTGPIHFSSASIQTAWIYDVVKSTAQVSMLVAAMAAL